MSQTPAEVSGIDRLNNALSEFASCLATAVPDICSWGLTIGEAYVPFDPDPDDDCVDGEVECSQLWVRVTDIVPKDLGDSFDDSTCDLILSIGLEVGVLRCFEAKDEGAAPTATEVLVANMVAMKDMLAIQCAALSCKDSQDRDLFASIEVGTWVPLGPLGLQYGGVWTFRVETFNT